ncbi:hypothetical protein Val02_78320 [Virgisporangium aliadipatigenens]|uniref:Uncharacterized protein n=1 Tax=Virgisporangium aliadipatigenens TaxID=741659 RepID=A0A8J3YW90_9ACTN|nr:hypothetical protein [Virgisporangium aliadipatigenens]GIJ50946.1 hypothetical protein Val02_78320 [Virgisporangium aliadipatigenens]
MSGWDAAGRKALRLIGYWDGRDAPAAWPDVCGFVSTAPDRAVQQAVAAWLRAGAVFVVTAGISVCRLCGTANGSAEQTDGDHFVWPDGLAHYVAEHGVQLPDEVVALAADGVIPPVDLDRFETAWHSGRLTIDTAWWAHFAGAEPFGTATTHLHGCRHSAAVAHWDLPTSAEIYIDGVPPAAVATGVRLRRLLGATWPMPTLRDLLDSQPFHAGSGDPSALHRALRTSEGLRSYLFYRVNDNLVPIWSD